MAWLRGGYAPTWVEMLALGVGVGVRHTSVGFGSPSCWVPFADVSFDTVAFSSLRRHAV
jgi:hypothetical protein